MLDVTGVRAGNKQGCKVDETSRSSKGSVRPCGEQREKARRVRGANSLDMSWSRLPWLPWSHGNLSDHSDLYPPNAPSLRQQPALQASRRWLKLPPSPAHERIP